MCPRHHLVDVVEMLWWASRVPRRVCRSRTGVISKDAGPHECRERAPRRTQLFIPRLRRRVLPQSRGVAYGLNLMRAWLESPPVTLPALIAHAPAFALVVPQVPFPMVPVTTLKVVEGIAPLALTVTGVADRRHNPLDWSISRGIR